MAAGEVNTEVFDGEVALALRLLEVDPSSPAVDALADPQGASLALSSLSLAREGRERRERREEEGGEERALLRVALPLAKAAAGYGPKPIDPVWLRIKPGSSEVAMAPLRLRGAQAKAEEQARRQAGREVAPLPRRARVLRVVVEQEAQPCCDALSCKLSRTVAPVWIEIEALDPSPSGEARRLLAAEARDLAPEKAVSRAEALASLLARALKVQLVVDGSAVEPAADLSPSMAGEPRGDGEEPRVPVRSAGELARYMLRSEGDRIVLRDHASAGPRLALRRTLGTGVVLAVLAALFWAQTARGLESSNQSTSIAFGTVAALLSLAAYAFLGVGRFAARYAADSAPLVAVGRDRLIVAPWVSREGAVDARPEGRLGAAIPLGEVHTARVRQRGDLSIVELTTDHGPINALSSERKDVAELLCQALQRSIDEVRHPSSGASSRQRARAKAKAAPVG